MINPFSEDRFILNMNMVKEILLPLLENKTKQENEKVPCQEERGKHSDDLNNNMNLPKTKGLLGKLFGKK